MNKKFFFVGLVFIVFLLAVFVVADFTLKTQSGDLVLDPNSGYTGVGTATPANKLSLSGGYLSVFAMGTTKGIWFDESSTQKNRESGTSKYGMAMDYSDTNNRLDFVGVIDDSETNVMTIERGGNVGIGTTSPGSKLHIKDGGIRIESTSSSAQLGLIADTGRTFYIGSEYSPYNRFVIWDDTASAYRMIIDSSRNVGVGITSPKAKLEVSSVIKSTPTDSPGTCNADLEGGMYYDASLNEPCFCDGSNWKQFDGGGNC